MDQAQTIRKGVELELEIEKLAFGGKALARVDGLVVFLEAGLPGQRVLARVVRKKRQFAEARVLEVVSRSATEVEPFCPHFGMCGGCRWQHLAYPEQLRWKRRHVLECLEHLAGFDETVVAPTVASPRTLYYRNKMEYTFSDRRWLSPEEIRDADTRFDRSFALGLHVRGFYDRVFQLEQCFLQSPESAEIVRAAQAWCATAGLRPYNTRDHQGFWRFLVIRDGKHTGELLVHVLTAAHPRGEAVVDGLAEHLRERFAQITTLVHSVSRKKAQVAVGDESRVLWGPGWIEERMGELRFRISAHSFFQTNPRGAEALNRAIVELAAFDGTETVWDLYCGTGSIALTVAPLVQRVVGFEVVEEAVADAYRNAAANGIENCAFRVGDLKDVIRHEPARGLGGEAPDVVITDPPRAGMHPEVVAALLETAPRRIIAVSCNPATLARDLALLSKRYAIGRVQPFDLFPHTPHIECVVSLERVR